MERSAVPELDPASLPMGTQVGPWRLEGWGGRGTYGVVYRAVRVGREEAGCVALKLALHPEDPRFEREVKLLSSLRHPSVPRFHGHGGWRHPSGAVHPYLAMQWIHGRPLYDWAAQRNPSSRQVLRVLAQVARALEAVHAVHAVHRDVKGGNVLVRPADGRVFLTDLGSGHYAGASSLTQQVLPPGTPAYRSPEAWRFVQRFGHDSSARYAATPADDLFALGVTACRLVTDEYPPSTEPGEDTAGLWRVDSEGPRPPAAINFRVELRLNALILQLLSARPEARGTSAELARTLEEVAEQAGPEADHPLFAWEALSPASWSPEDVAIAVGLHQRPRRRDRQVVRLSEQRDAAEKAEELTRVRAPAEGSPWRTRLTALAVGVLMLVGDWRGEPREASPEDGGTAGLGDDARTFVVASAPAPSPKGIRLEIPPKPFKGQRKAPCPKGDVEIRGGCWTKLETQAPDCQEYAYEWKGGCYLPIIPAAPPATSDHP
ncbi:serine/threonine protein kinase [Hyalangium rubrum]|uniref:Serine/threonine-protein kinase n=1 Tax=Hyalangium rubrum TaxID=3103134 RepID=A0ABU5HM39_9BACT|nr:serine/threonine-protein kinase [Hyalangium sp. s54d21]MDY7233185.1 serine/threonine-protein kinase [Hyalangium sp. s54d21]